MIVLGLNRGEHDASACIVRDGVLDAFISSERVTRRKHDGTSICEAAQYCLSLVGVEKDQIDLVVQNAYDSDLQVVDRVHESLGRMNASADYVNQFSSVVTIDHHLAHAECGAALAPFSDAAIMVIDGIGQLIPDGKAEAESFYRLSNGSLEVIRQRYGSIQNDGLKFHSFDSIGSVYSIVSTYLFNHWNYCGKVMGLAPFGSAYVFEDRLFDVNGLNIECDLNFREKLKETHKQNSNDWRNISQFVANVAWSVQKETESALVKLANALYSETGSKNLIFCGGVALNCVANRALLDKTPFERVFVPPVAGDDGTAIGCAFFGAKTSDSFSGRLVHKSPYCGKLYSEEAILEAIDNQPVIDISRPDNLIETVASKIANGSTVGWYQGASEMGPRALGNRSILADPRSASIKQHLNDVVKKREPFRPFGGSILDSCVGDFFDTEIAMPLMTFTARLLPGAAEKLPALAHIDGSCRIQTVSNKENPLYHALISEFGRLSGVPILLNTSFNRKGEPIVETPHDAISCFLDSDLDCLVIEKYLILRKQVDDFAGYSLEICSNLDIGQTIGPNRSPEWFAQRGTEEKIRISQTTFLALSTNDPNAKSTSECLPDLYKLHCKGWIKFVGY